ncbi:MAG: NAD-dependent epimerase/dehydratase family protein [Xanthobacteraceae bacterium]
MSDRIGSGDRIVVTGGGGLIGGCLVRQLIEQGFRRVRAADLKPLDDWFQVFSAADNVVCDLRQEAACRSVCRDLATGSRAGHRTQRRGLGVLRDRS